MKVIDPFKMSSISAEFGSLPKTHLQLQPGSRELLVDSPEQNWLISGSFGSFALTGNAARAPVLHALAAVQVPLLFI